MKFSEILKWFPSVFSFPYFFLSTINYIHSNLSIQVRFITFNLLFLFRFFLFHLKYFYFCNSKHTKKKRRNENKFTQIFTFMESKNHCCKLRTTKMDIFNWILKWENEMQLHYNGITIFSTWQLTPFNKVFFSSEKFKMF